VLEKNRSQVSNPVSVRSWPRGANCDRRFSTQSGRSLGVIATGSAPRVHGAIQQARQQTAAGKRNDPSAMRGVHPP